MIRKILYILLTGVFIAIWFYFIDLRKVLLTVRSASLLLLFIATVLGIVVSILMSYRAKLLLQLRGKISLRRLWAYSNFGSFLSMLFPFSVGGVVISYLIAKEAKVSYPVTLLIMFIDFILNYIPNIFLGVLAFFYFSDKFIILFSFKDLFSLPYVAILGIVFLLFGVFLYQLIQQNKIARILVFARKAWKLLYEQQVLLLKVVLLSSVIGIFGALSAYLYFKAFGMSPAFLDFIIASSLFVLLGLLPGTPLKIGQHEALGVITLPFLLGLDKNSVFTALFTSHLIGIILSLILGLYAMYYLKLDLSIRNKVKTIRTSLQ